MTVNKIAAIVQAVISPGVVAFQIALAAGTPWARTPWEEHSRDGSRLPCGVLR